MILEDTKEYHHFASPDNSVALGIHIKSLGGGRITRYLEIALKYFSRKKLIEIKKI